VGGIYFRVFSGLAEQRNLKVYKCYVLSNVYTCGINKVVLKNSSFMNNTTFYAH